MRALVFDLSIPRYLAAKALGPRRAPGLHYGRLSCLQLRDDVPEPRAPSDDWLGLRPRLTGLCGSDLAQIFFKWSPALTVYGALPAVMGHEIVADVVEVGAGARGRFREGDRVVVDPVLPCLARGLSPCARCVEGDYAVCERLTDAPGAMLGASAQVPGGFAERIVAHASQLFAVPSAMQDEVAALVEPLTVAVRAVLRHGPRPGERVLVVGGGTIAFAVLWAIHELCRDVSVSAYALEPYQLDIARRMGADAVLGEAPPHDLLHAAAADTGSRVLHPMLGRGFLAGGYDRVFDCVGTQQSVDDVLRVTRPGGTVVMVGTPGVLPGLDLTFLWVRQLRVEGTVYYGFETWRGERARTFDVTLDLLRTTAAPLAELVTHKLPLDRYAEAIEASVDRRGARSVKAVLAP